MSKEECCEQYCHLDIGNDPNKFFRMQNTMWAGSGSCVWIDKQTKTVGWRWNNPGDWIAPEVVVGDLQWSWDNGTWPSAFPIQYKNINTLTATVGRNYTQNPTGWYNLAFDIYWTSQGTYDRKYNIMIWREGELDNWNGETVNDGYNDYTVHLYYKGWPYVAFVKKNQNPNDTNDWIINIKSLMSQIKSSWHDVGIDDNWYIPSLELASESTGNGSGAITINKFNIELNGDTITLDDSQDSQCPNPNIQFGLN